MADQQLTTKFEVRLDKNGTVAEMIVPGFGYSDFDRAGYFTLGGFARHFDEIRAASLTNNFLDFSQLMSEGYIVTIGQEIDLNTAALRELRVTSNSPYKAQQTLTHIGSSSFTCYQSFHRLDGTTIATCLVRFAYVSWGSPKAQPLPSWFVDKFSSLVAREYGTLSLPPPPEVPPNSFRTTVKARFSDMDWNQHVNSAVYLDFCLDAATLAGTKGALKGFKGDMAFYPVEKAVALYRVSAVAGDELTVHTWQDSEDEAKLSFLISKAGGQPCLFAVITFKRMKYSML